MQLTKLLKRNWQKNCIMKNKEIVSKLFNFAETNGWELQESVSITRNASKLLFQISGGTIFEKELVGLNKAFSDKIVSWQNCLRTDTWEKIGYSGKHHLTFEMIGHFMFFKAGEKATKIEMINFAFKFLTEELSINPSHLIVTVHPDDKVSLKILKSLPVNEIRKNPQNISIEPFKLRYGTRVEIIWKSSSGTECELWNLVFHTNSYDKKNTDDGTMSADSGASIDRLARAQENKENDYETSYWREYLSLIVSEKNIKARLAEMLKASIFLLHDGLAPGNKGAEYVLRKIIREAYNLSQGIDECLNNYELAEYYWRNTNDSKRELFKSELMSYELALKRGEKELFKILEKNKTLKESDFIFLQETFGYPKILAIKKNYRK